MALLPPKDNQTRIETVKANNCDVSIPIVDLIASTLRYVSRNALDEVNKQASIPLTADRIHWILTGIS